MFVNCIRSSLYFFLVCTIATSHAADSRNEISMAVLSENERIIRKFCSSQSSRREILEENGHGKSYTAMGIAVKDKKLKSIAILHSLGAKFSNYVVKSNGRVYTVSQWFFYQPFKKELKDGYEVSDNEDDEVLGPVKEKCLKLSVEKYASTLEKHENGDYKNKEWKRHPQHGVYYPKLKQPYPVDPTKHWFPGSVELGSYLS